MRTFVTSLIVSLAAACPAYSQTTDALPVLDFSVGQQTVAASLTEQPDGSWAAPTLSLDGLTFSNITLDTDSDPFVHYSYSVSNTSGSAMPYTTSASTPVSLAPGSYTVTSSLGVSVTDFSSSSSGVSVTPTSTYIQRAFVDATEVTSADLGSGSIPEATFGATNTQNFSSGPFTYNVASSPSQISTTTSFSLSDGADVGITGFFQVAVVPEPSSIGLALIAAGAFAVLVVRTRRARA